MVKKGIAILLMILAVYWSFSSLMPAKISTIDAPEDQFSTQRALLHLKEISKKEHFLGSESHAGVRNYILKALKDLGLETQVQEGYSIDGDGEFSKPTNILGRIKGSGKGKALLLMTHYDSEPHSSFGASDAGSGVVTILESLRAFLSANKTSKNDIMVLITDAEELGLNGADIFVNKHPWAKKIGLALNFEARGSGGPSIMLIETNKGNTNLIKAFSKANPEFPLGNSLFYSIYKMLPNELDLTRFREDGDIDGLNFAFVDDHFDYHTALDTYDRLDRNTLEHQGSYLMPLLNYFSEADLSKLKSIDDSVYFNLPFFKMAIYPFSWIWPMFICAVLIFVLLTFYGLKKRKIELKSIGKGLAAFLTALVISGLLGVYSWKLMIFLYDEYSEMLQGFTYNGHAYIAAFVCLSIAVCMFVYSKVYKPENAASLLVGPLFFWLILCGCIALKLKGASFFVIPVLAGLLSFYVLLKRKKQSLVTTALLGFPTLIIFSPMVQMFPIGLGLKMLVASTVLIVLMFGLLVSVFAFFKHKKRWGYLFLLFALYYLTTAHFTSNFTDQCPKPNSLLYILDADANTAKWATYDKKLDDWTAHFFGPESSKTVKENAFISKYKTKIEQTNKAKVVQIPLPIIDIVRDTIIGEFEFLEICITPQRKVHRIDVFADTSMVFNTLKINGLNIEKEHRFKFNHRKSKRFFTYYLSNNEPLEIQLSIPKGQKTALTFYEASYDLLDNELLQVPDRYSGMIPKPFVLNDAVMVKKTIQIPMPGNN